jgi:hypothetical protein
MVKKLFNQLCFGILVRFFIGYLNWPERACKKANAHLKCASPPMAKRKNSNDFMIVRLFLIFSRYGHPFNYSHQIFGKQAT